MTNPTKPETKPASSASAFAPFQDLWTAAVERMQQIAHAQQHLASVWLEAAGVTDQLAKTQQQMMSLWTEAAVHGEKYATVEKDLFARTQSTMAGWAQMAQDAVAYGAQLSTEARKFTTVR